MSRSAVCRAKDPTKCPYHGAVIRMHDAARTGDLNAYFEARKQVEALEKDSRTEEDLLQNLSDAYALMGTQQPEPKEPVTVAMERMEQVCGTVERIRFKDEKDEDVEEPRYLLADNHLTAEKILFVRDDMDLPQGLIPTTVRIQLDTPIADEQEREQLAGLIGYMHKAINHPKKDQMVAENWWDDSSHSIVAAVDFNTSSNPTLAMGEFADCYQTYVTEGSPERRDGTQAIAGLDSIPSSRLWFGYEATDVARDYPEYIEEIAEESGS